MTLLEKSLGELATSIPGATALFREYHLDFCCEGQRSLQQAATARGLDPKVLETHLEALKGHPLSEADWRGVGNDVLIAHILERYHDKHREQLPELLRLARRVEQVHGSKPECPAGLAQLLADMQQELEGHMLKEEQILFPMLSRASAILPEGPISVMRSEHHLHGRALQMIDELTNNLNPPANACNTWRALYVGLAAFKNDLIEHIHLENNILFEGLAAKPITGCGCGSGAGECS